MTTLVICYKLHTPIEVAVGKFEDTFLECYVNENNAQRICDEFNATATDREYFIQEQEMFD